MPLSLVTAPTQLAVSVEECKQHCYGINSEDDALVERFIKAATANVQRRIDGSRQLMAATYDWKTKSLADLADCDSFVEIPRPPLNRITSITYANSTGGTSTLSTSVYEAVTHTDQPGGIQLKPGQSWPVVQSARKYPVTVRFVCGSTSSTGVPDDAKQAVYLLVGDYFENRGDAQEKTSDKTEKAVDAICGSLGYGSYA